MRPSAASSVSTISGVAPFCGPKIRAAPIGPVSGLRTSQSTSMGRPRRSGRSPERSMRSSCASGPPPGAICRPVASSRRTPSAAAMPAPPSTVALPPTPMTNRRAPASTAAAIRSPVPAVEASSGLRSAGASSGRPEAAAISITAVPSSSSRYEASIGRPSGSRTRAVRRVPPRARSTASTVPSPPSARGTASISICCPSACAARCAPCASATATSAALRLPLREAGAISRRMAVP